MSKATLDTKNFLSHLIS